MEDEELTTVPVLSIVETQERANIDMLIATAKKYPRDLARVRRSMEAMATLDEDTAASCNYFLSRNGKSIEGPSVRMAEIAVASYQNIRCGCRVIGNDGKTVTGQGFCHDLENNLFIAFETQRRITDKLGNLYSEDMQVLTGNAAAAIAFRNAVFKVIPGAFIKPVAEKAKSVAVGDLKTLTQRRTRALNSFAKIGVTEARVLEMLGRRNTEEIDLADVEKLFGTFTAIREGTTTIEESFPKPAPKTVEPNFDNLPKRRGRPPKPAPAIEPLAESQSAPGGQPESLEPYPEQAPATAKPEVPKGRELPPAEEIAARLTDEAISPQKFLFVMFDYGLTEGCSDPLEIEEGRYALPNLALKDCELALKNWPKILQELGKANEKS